LLAIMVEPAWRSQGVGARLVIELIDECVKREFDALDVTVDAQNEGARRFYAQRGFGEQGRFTLYGRAMCTYRLPLAR
jgi:ribosomal protein S18 acetylase RimI-like enzyme